MGEHVGTKHSPFHGVDGEGGQEARCELSTRIGYSRKLTGAFLDEGERFGQAVDGGRWVVMDGAALRYAGGGVYLGRGCCRVVACHALHLKDGANNDVRLVSALMLRDVLLARVHRNLLDRAYRLHFSGGLKEGERARAEGDIDWGIGCASVFA